MKKKTCLPKEPVASGGYVVSEKKNAVLEAYLGTCVGVTLADEKARVGGLLHILLPEPTETGEVWNPENYASTGLPIFIEALCEAGADKKRLRGCIAGGALVGPLSERDLNLDIGGRTSDIVEKILGKEGIEIDRTETGGFFTCRLGLDLSSWETYIEPLEQTVSGAKIKNVVKPSAEQIEKVMGAVNPIPQIALKLIRMIREEKYSLTDMAKEARQDQVISAKVISLCNSALINMKIDSIDRALIVLGEKKLLQLILSAALEDFFPTEKQGYSLCKGGLYKHAIGTAMIAERLANYTGVVSSDIAYTTGLLHDIGKVVLDQYIASDYPYFYRRTEIEGIDLIKVETEDFGLNHPQVGSRLAERWSLPENLKDAIRHHHDPENAEVDPTLTHLVYVADLLMSRFIVGQELERLNTKTLSERLGKIGVEPEQFPFIIDNIPHQIFHFPFRDNIHEE